MVERADHDGQGETGQPVGRRQQLPVAVVGGQDQDAPALGGRAPQELGPVDANPREHDIRGTEEVATGFDEIHPHVLKGSAPQTPDLLRGHLPTQATPDVVQRHAAAARQEPPQGIADASADRQPQGRGEVGRHPSHEEQAPETHGRRHPAGAWGGPAHPTWRTRLVTPHTMAAISAESGMVRIQAQTMLLATPQRTAESRWVAPTPRIEAVMVWVVLTGIPATAVPRSVIAPAVSAQKPPIGRSLVNRMPIVFTMRQPPASV